MGSRGGATDEKLVSRDKSVPFSAENGAPRLLYYEIIKRALFAQRLDTLQEVASQSAAYATVMQFDHLGLFLNEFWVFDFIRVKVDSAHIVHDERALPRTRYPVGVDDLSGVSQDLLQQGGFSGSQKSRENGDGQSFVLNILSHNTVDLMDDSHFVDTSVRGVYRCGWDRRARKKVKPRLTKRRVSSRTHASDSRKRSVVKKPILEKRGKETEGAFAVLPNDVLVELVDDCLVDPTDAAVLRSVSKRLRTAVDETGRNLTRLINTA